jgi:protein TonB
MSNLRVPFAVVGGALFSSAVFLALYQFISVPLNIGPPLKAVAIEFTRQRVDTPLENKRDPKIEKLPPPTLPASTQLIVDTFTPVERTPVVRPKIDPAPTDSRKRTPGIDHDAIPFVRVTPDYPPRAATRGIEGWVQIQFAVTAAGTVRDPVVVAAEPRGIFEDAALKAIARWRYNPRIDGGVAVERVGLQTVIRFELQR